MSDNTMESLPSQQEVKELRKEHYKRSVRLTAIIMIYGVCWVFLVLANKNRPYWALMSFTVWLARVCLVIGAIIPLCAISRYVRFDSEYHKRVDPLITRSKEDARDTNRYSLKVATSVLAILLIPSLLIGGTYRYLMEDARDQAWALMGEGQYKEAEHLLSNRLIRDYRDNTSMHHLATALIYRSKRDFTTANYDLGFVELEGLTEEEAAKLAHFKELIAKASEKQIYQEYYAPYEKTEEQKKPSKPHRHHHSWSENDEEWADEWDEEEYIDEEYYEDYYDDEMFYDEMMDG